MQAQHDVGLLVWCLDSQTLTVDTLLKVLVDGPGRSRHLFLRPDAMHCGYNLFSEKLVPVG